MSDSFHADVTLSHLMKELVPAKDLPHAKVTVVGSGQVGMACAFSILVQVSFPINFALTKLLVISFLPIFSI